MPSRKYRVRENRFSGHAIERLMAELHPPAPPPPPAPEPEPDSPVKRPGPRYNRLLPLPTELEMNERGIPLDW